MLIFRILILLILTNNVLNIIYCTDNKRKITEETKIKKTKDSDSSSDSEESEEDKCNLELLDQIVSEVSFLNSETPETNIITNLDIRRRGFDGRNYTAADLENQCLADELSKLLKATVSNDDVNRNLKKNGMDEKQILDLADAWGYLNKDEFFEDLKKMFRSQSAMNFEIESQLVSTQDEIEKYYYDHLGQYQEEAQYFVETVFIPFSKDKTKEELKAELEAYCQGKISKLPYIIWEAPLQINESEITANNRFLTDLPINSIFIKEFDDGFNIYRMKNMKPRRAVPLDTVKEEIVLKLKESKFATAYQNVVNKLRNQAIIVHPAEIYSVPCNSEELEIS